MRPPLLVTLGDPCGIGPELLIKALPTLLSISELTVVGAKAAIDLLGSQGAPFLKAYEAGQLAWIDPTPQLSTCDLTLGKPSAASGLAAVEAVRTAANHLMKHRSDALVTLPLSKHAAHLAGFPIPGHTEFLQALCQAPATRMAFLSPTLNVVLHTTHESLLAVIQGLSAEKVADTLLFTARHFPWPADKPLRIALCALNPHGGEQGAFGQEEALLEAALAHAQGTALRRPCAFTGPYPADTVFLRALKGAFDVVVALYHDQGLIPIKLMEPTRAVNCTLGLPFVRTSPDHGTAFDIAGQWQANADNLLAAVETALTWSHPQETAIESK